MFIAKGFKLTGFALSGLLLLLCLTVKVLASESPRATVHRGALYLVQDDGWVIRYGEPNFYLKPRGPFVDGVSKVSGLENITAFRVGADHALALDSDGCIWAWGSNRHGQLGFQDKRRLDTPKKFNSFCGISDLDAGTYSSMLLFKDENSVALWGAGVPDEIAGRRYRFEEPIESVVSYSLSFAITKTGSVYAWGSQGTMRGILKTDAKRSWKPEKLDIPCHVKHIDVSLDVMFVCESGDVYIYGRNIAGTLGTGNTKPYRRITKHPSLSGVDKIMGGTIRIAKLENGKYLGWGDQLLGPVEWTNGGYMVDPEEIDVPEGVVDFYSYQSSMFFIHKDGNVFRLVPEEHWLFPLKYSLEDYHFQEYSSQRVTRP